MAEQDAGANRHMRFRRGMLVVWRWLSLAFGQSVSRRTKIILVVTGTALVFVPFPTRISEETVVRFVAPAEIPVTRLKVYQNWECYNLFGGGRDECTADESGYVRFPARVAYGTVASRIFGRLFTSVAVHASYGCRMRLEFSLDAPSRAVFSPAQFKRLEPFATSGSYLDSVGRCYYPRVEKGKQYVSIDGDFLHEADRITIMVE